MAKNSGMKAFVETAIENKRKKKID